jgi:hypothetical protein
VVISPTHHEKFQKYYNPSELALAKNELPSEICKPINSVSDTEELPWHLMKPAIMPVYQDIHRVPGAVTCGILEARNCQPLIQTLPNVQEVAQKMSTVRY